MQPSYQARGNAKSIYALDNLWDGLGALIVLDPRAKYLFGKVTMYTTYKAVARNALIWFLRRYFPDRDNLVEGIHPLRLDLDDPYYEQLFTGQTYQENYRILIQKIREFNENIPPLINAYMTFRPRCGFRIRCRIPISAVSRRRAFWSRYATSIPKNGSVTPAGWGGRPICSTAASFSANGCASIWTGSRNARRMTSAASDKSRTECRAA